MLEQTLTTCCKADMISYMATHPEDFEEAISLAISNKQPYSWRSAWLLWSCLEDNDQRIQKHISSIISSLSAKEANQQRELIKILLLMDLKEEDEGFLFDFCATIWRTLSHKPSVRFNAFKMIIKIAKRHPDLRNEIEFLTENEYMDSLSSAAQKSIYKMLAELK